MTCPNCRYKLTFKEWKKKLDYEKSRQSDKEIINQLNKDIISYNKYKEKSTNILKGVLNKITEMKRRIKSKENYKLISLANNLSSEVVCPPLKDISNVIYDELDQFSDHIKKNYNIIQKKDEKDSKNYSKEIVLKYRAWDKKNPFFGKKFVENNKDKIDITIDGNEYPLESNYNLNKREFTMKIIFREPITNFEHMFNGCNLPSNLEELKNIDISSATNLSYTGSSSGYTIIRYGVYSVTVRFSSIGTKTFVVNGNKYIISEQIVEEVINENGKDVTWDNPLIDSKSMAESLLSWIKDYYLLEGYYEFNTRGNPEIDANDAGVQTKYTGNLMDVLITDISLGFNGAFSGAVKTLKKGDMA